MEGNHPVEVGNRPVEVGNRPAAVEDRGCPAVEDRHPAVEDNHPAVVGNLPVDRWQSRLVALAAGRLGDSLRAAGLPGGRLSCTAALEGTAAAAADREGRACRLEAGLKLPLAY